MKVYSALYNPMIHESGYVTISLHRSMEGAVNAAEKHKAKRKKEFDRLWKNDSPPSPFGTFEDWAVDEVDILP